MFNINDTVVYGFHGVCIIEDISTQTLGNSQKEYYVLRPVYNDKSTIFVPMDSPKLIARMRRLLDAPQIRELLELLPSQPDQWIPSPDLRKEHHRSILAGHDRLELMKMIRSIYLHQKELHGKSKKLYAADEHALKDAEKLLYEEISYVLGVPREQVLGLIVG